MSEQLTFIVRQFNWLRFGKVCIRTPGERRIAWFDTAEQAERDRFQREARLRHRYNPFHFGTAWHQLTTMPDYVYQDWLLDHGLEVPPGLARDLKAWADWWDSTKATRDAAQTEAVWEGLNRVRFYDVIARRPSETGYCVSRILWDYDDSWYHAGHEGGQPLKVYRTRQQAERERERLEAQAKVEDRHPDWGFFPRDPEQILEYTLDQGAYQASQVQNGVPHYEVIEIDLLEGGQ